MSIWYVSSFLAVLTNTICVVGVQEVDIVDVDSGTVIGTVVVDVRGHLCLMECS